MAAHELAKVVALEEDLLAARSETDALRSTCAQRAVHASKLSAVTGRRAESLIASDCTAYRAGAAVRAAADAKATQARAFQEQRQRADQLAGNLALTQRELELLKAEAVRRRAAAETSIGSGEASP